GAGLALIEELGPHLVALETSALALGYLRMLQDNWPAAEREFRAVCEALEGLGETGFTSSSAARLAWCLCQQGRNEEAETVTRMSERSASSEDVFSQVLWRAARATATARQGQLEKGESLAREAVRRVAETDMPELTGDAFMALATLLAAADRCAEAVSVVDAA